MAPTSINILLPDGLEDYVKERVAEGEYRSPGDFVRHLIRADMESRGRQELERLLLEGLASGPADEVTPDYLDALTREAEDIIAAGARSGG